MRVKDKVAIVTGAASGIGRATAEVFGEEGAKVVVADIDRLEGEKTTATINGRGGVAHFVQADISKEDDARRIAEETVHTFGRIDVLVNNAATFVLKGVAASVEDWQQSLGVNVIGTALVTKYCVEHMKNTGGAIVTISSMSAYIAQPDFYAYSSTKAALVQMTRSWAQAFAQYRIRANAVCPGSILTSASFRHMKHSGVSEQQFRAEEGAKTFLGRIGEPREVAYAVLFLASDEASFITGASLIVDGGYTAQ